MRLWLTEKKQGSLVTGNAVELTAEERNSRCCWVKGLGFFGVLLDEGSDWEACERADVVDNARRDWRQSSRGEGRLRTGRARHRDGAMVGGGCGIEV